MNNRGMPIIGLGAQSAEYAELPLQWMPHFQVADVGVSVAEALEKNGHELMHGKDEEGVSQWAVIADPNGAVFGLIPVVADDMLKTSENNHAVDHSAAVGHIAWLDLTVSSATAIADFYHAVIGWGVEETAMQDGNDSYVDYTMLNGNNVAVAGVCHARGVNVGLPPVWLLYLPVGNLQVSLEYVNSFGGQVIDQSVNDEGRITQALIQDPVGVFSILVQV